MKKITLLSAAAMVAVAAQAQYNVDPSTSVVVAENPTTVEYITLSEGAVADFEKAGAKVTYIGPDENEGRNLWYWDNTFTAGDDSLPRVDMEEGGYVSVVVSTVGWSGAGFDCQGNGINLSHFDNDTHFHIAYMTPSGNGPASIAVILFDGDASKPAKFALGDPFNDNGAVFPSVGAKANDDWQAVDITLGDIRKLYPSFNLGDTEGREAWKGNIMEWLGGGIAGQTMAFDAIYFYSNKAVAENAVEGVEADAQFVVTANTVNVAGGAGIELYNLGGALVKSTNGTTLGLNGLASGVYVAKSGNVVRKVVVK